MLTVKINVTHHPAGVANLRKMCVGLRNNVASRVCALAKETCPVDTGALRESGTWRPLRDAAHVIFGESNEVAARHKRVSYTQRPKSRVTGEDRGPEFYALWVEVGSRVKTGGWFMTRALLNVLKQPMPTEKELLAHWKT